MEIILNEKDLETLIKNTYKGVSSVTFNTKDIKATLLLTDLNTFIQNPIKKVVEPVKKETQEEKNIKEAKTGVMSSGGGSRTIIRM